MYPHVKAVSPGIGKCKTSARRTVSNSGRNLRLRRILLRFYGIFLRITLHSSVVITIIYFDVHVNPHSDR